MPTYRLRGIDVDFPYEAYECQLVYMEKVIQSLQNKCNALLESPTGTGKTLCLLCATLAWRKSLGPFSTGKLERNGQTVGSKSDSAPSLSQSQGDAFPTIVYTSRTHSQLRQVIQELKRSNYRPKMVILGSRQQLCIHEDVSLLHGKAQDNACHLLCKKRDKGRKRYCSHFPRVSDYVKQNPHLGDEPIDIEDLVNIGKTSGPCPYYVSREIHRVVDILFAPYNYLIDRGNRKSLSIQWENSILIFDEAHNLESLCADAASFDLPSGVLSACVSEAETCQNLSAARRERSSDKTQNPENFAILRALLLKLEARIADVTIKSKELGFTQPGPYIYELLTELNITHETASKLIDIIEEASVLLEEEKTKDGVCRLESISNILKLIFKDKNNDHAEHYRVHVQEIETYGVDSFKGKSSRMLSWWCFNPGIAMEEFDKLGVGSIILTSGTLSPMDSFAQELKLDFPVRLENPHVISSNQIWTGVVPAGPSGRSFNSSYKNRDSVDYKRELGNAIESSLNLTKAKNKAKYHIFQTKKKNKSQFFTEMASNKQSYQAGQTAGKTEEKGRGMAESARDKAQEAKDKTFETAQQAKDKTNEMTETAKQKTQEAAHSTRDKSGQTNEASRQKAEETKEQTSGILQETAEKMRDMAQGAADAVKQTFGMAEGKAAETKSNHM